MLEEQTAVALEDRIIPELPMKRDLFGPASSPWSGTPPPSPVDSPTDLRSDSTVDPLDIIFRHLDHWRHLPSYQLERRADVFFSVYLTVECDDHVIPARRQRPRIGLGLA